MGGALVRIIRVVTAATLAGLGFSAAAQADSQLSAPISFSFAPTGDAAPSNLQMAQNTVAPTDASTPAPVPSNAVSNYFANYFAVVEQAQASQPHWMTPIVTVTPRLEQEVRYDQFWQYRGNGQQQNVFDGGKGLELIPTGTNEVLINPPAYQERVNTKHNIYGWLDDQFLVVKQRLLSANEQQGNYIVTAFLGVTAPSGNAAFTNGAWAITPTLAGGKGWGDFDIQATTGISLLTRNQSSVGDSIATNIAFQYHFLEYFWPELEVNHTYWLSGKQRGGKNQVFLTPGIIFGRFVIHERVKAIVGVGYQIAVAPTYQATPVLTPIYNHALILTTRLTF
jgi:hypothetical protein